MGIASDSTAIVADNTFDALLNVTFWPDGLTASVLSSYKLECRDGLTTRELDVTEWQLDDGEWKRLAWYEFPDAVEGANTAPFGGTIRLGTCCGPRSRLQELKHLAADGGPTAPGMYLAVEFSVSNRGTIDATPGSYQVALTDGTGKMFSPSVTVDDFWSGDADDRWTSISPGDSTYPLVHLRDSGGSRPAELPVRGPSSGDIAGPRPATTQTTFRVPLRAARRTLLYTSRRPC